MTSQNDEQMRDSEIAQKMHKKAFLHALERKAIHISYPNDDATNSVINEKTASRLLDAAMKEVGRE